jgi:hypothetical protein
MSLDEEEDKDFIEGDEDDEDLVDDEGVEDESDGGGALNYGKAILERRKPDTSKLAQGVFFDGKTPVAVFDVGEEIAIELYDAKGEWRDTYVCRVKKIDDVTGLVHCWNATFEQQFVADMKNPTRHKIFITGGKRLVGLGKKRRGKKRKKR